MGERWGSIAFTILPTSIDNRHPAFRCGEIPTFRWRRPSPFRVKTALLPGSDYGVQWLESSPPSLTEVGLPLCVTFLEPDLSAFLPSPGLHIMRMSHRAH